MGKKYCEILDVAKYIIDYCNEKNLNISNLKLQKILYYIHGAFLAKYDEPLFISPLEHWKYGPVYPIAYYEYRFCFDSDFKQMDRSFSDLGLDSKQMFLINKIIDEKAKKDAFDLVNDTHNESPWEKTNVGQIIPDDYVKEYFLTEDGRKNYEY